MSAPFYPKDINDVITREWLGGATTKQLMEKYGYKTHKSITDKLKQKGITAEQLRRKNSERSYYYLDLSKIDDMFKAYFLGLMATDGYICDDNAACGIDLTDEDCIQSISLYTGKPYQSYDKTKYVSTYKSEDFEIHGNKKVFRIRFDGKPLVNQLIERGIGPHKSKTIKSVVLHQEERKFYPYVIRGIIDGDGSVFRRYDGALSLSICSASPDFAEWIKDTLENVMFFEKVGLYKYDKGRKTTMYEVSTSLAKNMELLYLLSYLPPMGMTRKRNLLLEGRSETIIGPSL